MGKIGVYKRFEQVRNIELHRVKFFPYCTIWNIELSLLYERQKNSIEPKLWP